MIQSQQPYNWKYPTLLTLSTITVVLSLTWPKPQFKASIPMPARVEEAIHLPASQTLKGHSTWVYAVAISPDNKYLASGSYDGQIKIWNLKTGQLLHQLSGHTDAIQTLAISPDGILASGGWDNRVRLWNLETGTLIRTLKGHVEDVKTLAISSDGKWLASGSADQTIKLWHLQTGKQHLTLKTSDWIRSVSFSPDNQTLASGSENGSVQIWSVTDGKPLHTLAGHSQAVWSVAFSPDGQTLATGSTDKTVKLWQLSNQQLQDTLVGHSKAVWSVAFSPDGQTLASGSYDKSIRLWNPKTGQSIRDWTGHKKPVWSVIFSPDGQTLASGSGDETVKLWQIDSSLKPQTKETTESPEKQVSQPSVSEVMNAEKMAELNQQLYQAIDQKWQSVQFNETLVYQVKVTTDGKVASYRPVNAAASYWVTKTPLEKLRQTNVSSESLIEFEVVMKPDGILEVAPIQGWNNRP
ncbi:MAG: WD40 repeat domain-containing protein [Cyanobacteria bacterium J06592_8]